MAVSVIDYGVGNIGSVQNMFRRIGVETSIASTGDDVMAAERLLLPGVGAFDHGMEQLHARDLVEPLKEAAARGTPLLGICLGMQLLMESSAEGAAPGLGLISGGTKRLVTDETRRVPHMGWNTVEAAAPSELLRDLESNRFYFVHSYAVIPDDAGHVIGTTSYGTEFASMIGRANVLGAQFHPEKSHRFGATMLTNFAAI